MVSQPASSIREDIYATLKSSRAELHRAIDGLSPEQMINPVIDGWSIKDQLAHVAFWDELGAQDFRRVAAGHSPALMFHAPDRTDDLNNVIMAMRSKFSLDQVLTEFDSARTEMMSSLEALPDEAFNSGFVPAYLGICGRHDEEHSELIDRWRKEARV